MAASINDKFTEATNGSRPVPTTLTALLPSGASPGTATCGALTGWPTATAVHFIIYTVDVNGRKVSGSQTDWKGIVSGSTITGLVLKAGTNNGYSIGAVVEAAPTAAWADDVIEGLAVSHKQDGTMIANLPLTTPALSAPTITSPPTNVARVTGEIAPYIGRTAPTDWLLCYGQAVSRTTYADLYALMVPNMGTFTVTIATPGVVTLASHGLQTGDTIFMTTTGALPTGLSINTLYYIVRVDANTFNLATSYANAIAGTKITTSGSQSGTHTMRGCPYGLGDGTTTFNVPDLRGRTIFGLDIMGGTSADRLTNPSATVGGINGDVLGFAGGEENHTMTITELVQHNHIINGAVAHTNGSTYPGVTDDNSQPRTPSTANTGSSTPFNVVPRGLIMTFIIKT